MEPWTIKISIKTKNYFRLKTLIFVPYEANFDRNKTNIRTYTHKNAYTVDK